VSEANPDARRVSFAAPDVKCSPIESLLSSVTGCYFVPPPGGCHGNSTVKSFLDQDPSSADERKERPWRQASAREDERGGGTRERGSHCGRDARAPIGSFARKTRERGRLARFVGLTFSRAGDKEPGPESLKFVANQEFLFPLKK
jgi:hypothetical protein